MSSDRLTELRRQRALLQEHLAWLDREIARENGGPSPAPLPMPVPVPDGGAELSPEAARAAEEILAQYRQESVSQPQDIKRGCYLYFVCFMCLLAILAGSAFFIYTSFRQ